jgi:hypothetical protein
MTVEIYRKKVLFQILYYSSLVLVGMLALSLLAHINPLKHIIYIYYYRMLCYVFITGTFIFVILVVFYIIFSRKKKSILFKPDLFIPGVIIFLLFAAFFVTAGPMPMDRSYSIFVIADMYENPDKVYTAQEIEQTFMEKYILKNEATRRRIEEQKSIGNIEEIDGGYRISEKGKRLIKMMRFVESMYPVDEKRTLYPR